MWMVSLLIIVPVVWLAIGLDLPQEVNDVFEKRFTGSVAPAVDVVAYSFVVGLFIGGTPAHVYLRSIETWAKEPKTPVSGRHLAGRIRQAKVDTSSLDEATRLFRIVWRRARVLTHYFACC